MGKIKIRQVKSSIDHPERQKRTLKALGLGRIDSTNEIEASPQVEGMIRKVAHLVEVEKTGKK